MKTLQQHTNWLSLPRRLNHCLCWVIKTLNSDALRPIKLVTTATCMLTLAIGLVAGGFGHGRNPDKSLTSLGAKLGAGFREVGWDFEWYRLFTSGLLHHDDGHLINNALWILLFGILLEKLLGWTRTILLFLASAVGGNIIALLDPYRGDPYEINMGASTIVYGLVGCALMLAITPTRLRGHEIRICLAILLTPYHLWYLINQIDNAEYFGGHLGGLLSGMLLGWLYTRNLDFLKKGKCKYPSNKWGKYSLLKTKQTKQKITVLALIMIFLLLGTVIASMQTGQYPEKVAKETIQMKIPFSD